MSAIERLKDIFKKSNKRKDKARETETQLKIRYFLEIKNIEASLKYDSLDVASVRLFSLVKDFFSELLRESGSMTLEEIDNDLKYKHIEMGAKEKARELLKTLIPLEYGEVKITRKDMKSLLKYFRDIVEEI